MAEQQNLEYKSTWRDECLKWVCGFANAQGGKIFIGVDDKGNVIGLDDHSKLMDEIPNKTVNYLGLVVDVNLHHKDGKHYIEIDVPASEIPVSYHGIFHYRSGSTRQQLKGIALQNWLLKRMGKNWEDIPVPSATLNDLDEATIQKFLQKAIAKQRIPADAINYSLIELLEKLDLTKDGQLTNAAVLLFGKRPSSVSAMCSFKIGRFVKDYTDLRFQDVVETNLFLMIDKVMEKLNDRYLIRPISYEGWERMEPLEYPEDALREAILNAIIHKDYLSTFIFLRVFNDWLEIWNPGALPEELTIEKLKGKHSSYPRNPNIAEVFFRAGYIESWGRGTNKIIEDCLKANLPEPKLEQYQGGISITFFKDIYTEEYLTGLGLNERQKKAIQFLKEHKAITNGEFRKLTGVSGNTALRDLKELCRMGIAAKIGEARSDASYVLRYRHDHATFTPSS